MLVPDEVAFNLRVVTMYKDSLAAQEKNDPTVKAALLRSSGDYPTL